MLNSGAQPVVKNTYVPPVQKMATQQPTQATPQATTFATAYNPATSQAIPPYIGAAITQNKTGGTGVQFGAFSTESAAQTQVANVKSKLGVNAVVEPTGTGLYRVRVYGLTDTTAGQLKSQATANGIDSYVFH